MIGLDGGTIGRILSEKNTYLRPTLQIVEVRLNEDGEKEVLLNDSIFKHWVKVDTEQEVDASMIIKVNAYQVDAQQKISLERFQVLMSMDLPKVIGMPEFYGPRAMKAAPGTPQKATTRKSPIKVSPRGKRAIPVEACTSPGEAKRQRCLEFGSLKEYKESAIFALTSPDRQDGAPANLGPLQYTISNITLDLANWYLVGRVVLKHSIRKWTSAAGKSGKIFNFDIQDDEHQRIRCNAYGKLADKMFETIEQGSTYRLENLTVKLTNPKYRSFGDFDLLVTSQSVVEVIYHDAPLTNNNCPSSSEIY